MILAVILSAILKKPEVEEETGAEEDDAPNGLQGDEELTEKGPTKGEVYISNVRFYRISLCDQRAGSLEGPYRGWSCVSDKLVLCKRPLQQNLTFR